MTPWDVAALAFEEGGVSGTVGEDTAWPISIDQKAAEWKAGHVQCHAISYRCLRAPFRLEGIHRAQSALAAFLPSCGLC